MRPASAATRGPADPPRLLAVLSGVALAAALTSLYVHLKLTTAGGAYASFCNVNTRINCDVVLTSSYALLAGVPVAAWAALSYLALILLTLAHRRELALGGILVLAAWNLLFSLYMATVATLVLRTVCLLCTLLYVLSLAIAAAAWPLLRELRRREAARGRGALRLGLGGALTVAAATLASAWHFASARAGAPPSEFLRQYVSLPVVKIADEGRHERGPQNAAVTIVEFSDFECPHCARARAALDRVLSHQPREVRLVFHHFPLDAACNWLLGRTVHPHACQAAAAAECAGLQGRFWEYSDRLFASQANLRPETFERLAAEVGLDAEAFRRCLRSDKPAAAIEADIRAAAAARVSSTPTFFFNGRKVTGALDAALYEKVIAYERQQGRRAGSVR